MNKPQATPKASDARNLFRAFICYRMAIEEVLERGPRSVNVTNIQELAKQHGVRYKLPQSAWDEVHNWFKWHIMPMELVRISSVLPSHT